MEKQLIVYDYYLAQIPFTIIINDVHFLLFISFKFIITAALAGTRSVIGNGNGGNSNKFDYVLNSVSFQLWTFVGNK